MVDRVEIDGLYPGDWETGSAGEMPYGVFGIVGPAVAPPSMRGSKGSTEHAVEVLGQLKSQLQEGTLTTAQLHAGLDQAKGCCLIAGREAELAHSEHQVALSILREEFREELCEVDVFIARVVERARAYEGGLNGMLRTPENSATVQSIRAAARLEEMMRSLSPLHPPTVRPKTRGAANTARKSNDPGGVESDDAAGGTPSDDEYGAASEVGAAAATRGGAPKYTMTYQTEDEYAKAFQ